MDFSPFYHREQQLTDLNKMLDRDGPAFVIVYGRRRVGKTWLIQYWAQRSGLPTFYWVATRTTPENLRSELVSALWSWQSPDREVESAPRYDHWRDVFRAIRRIAGDQPMVIILDEFPWAVDSDPSLPSQLQAAWDSLFLDSRVKLIISGSHIATMESLLASDAPLFGRLTGKLYVPPFEFHEIADFIPNYPPDKQLAAYAVVGGVPDYLRHWSDRADLMENIREIFLSENSPFRNESDILISDVLRRDSPHYLAVLSAVAKGHRELADLSSAAVLEKDRASVVLSTLINLRLIEKRIRASTPLDQHETARYARYFLADPFLRFFFYMVVPHRTHIAQQNYAPILRDFTQQMRSFVGAAFEDLCRSWTLNMMRAGKLPFAPDFVGSDWRGDTQIDVMAVNWREGRVLAGEAKWTEADVDLGVHTKLIDHTQLALAYMPIGKSWWVQHVLFSRNDFTPPCRQAAKAAGTQLLTFEEIVDDLRTIRGPVIR